MALATARVTWFEDWGGMDAEALTCDADSP